MRLIDAVITRLKCILHDKGLTAYSLHRDGGIAKSSLSQLMNGKQKNISLEFLYQIISTIGIPLKAFFDDPIFDEVTD